MRKRMMVCGCLLMLLAGALMMGCTHPGTILDTEGDEMELEVSEMLEVEINGSEQWIYVSGASRQNPVILWLDGGPGGSEVGWVRKYLGPLHADATVVCWDQRGTAKSFHAVDAIDEVTVDDYVRDVISMSEYLIDRFSKQRIYLLGHSWGSVIGVLAAQRRPDLFAGYFGAGQHINSIENDGIGWEMIYEGAKRAGENKMVEKLEEMGKPPYLKDEKTPDGDAYYYLLSKLYRFSPTAPADHRFTSLDMFFAPEHSLIDRINLIRGLRRGVIHIYPQLAFTDLEKEVRELDIPVYLINGRYDRTCVAEIAERWFDGLEAPEKQMLWLEGSGHNGVFTEPEKVIDFITGIIGTT